MHTTERKQARFLRVMIFSHLSVIDELIEYLCIYIDARINNFVRLAESERLLIQLGSIILINIF